MRTSVAKSWDVYSPETGVFMKLGLSMAWLLASLMTASPALAAALGHSEPKESSECGGYSRIPHEMRKPGRYIAFDGDTIRIRTQVIVNIVDGRKRTFTLHLRRVN